MDRILRLFLWLSCLPACAAAAQQVDAERMAACAACHGAAGEGREAADYYPHLAGKPAGYLADQLRAFRDGRRVHPQMSWLMRNMGDAYLDAIGGYYAALPSPVRPHAGTIAPAYAERARALVEHGDAQRRIPACAACHGADLAGQAPGVPALAGLPPDYVIAQLGAWRTGVRRAVEPDCMAEIARALAPEDLRPLGEWLSMQGGEPHAPAPAGSFSLPRACGAMPATEDAR